MLNIPGYDDDGYPIGTAADGYAFAAPPVVTLPAATHPDTPRGVALSHWLAKGYSVVGYHVGASLAYREAEVEVATIYARGPFDRAATVVGDNGRSEFTYRDGLWFDNAGVMLSPADSKLLEDSWQRAAGLID